MHVKFFGGEIKKIIWNRDKNSWRGESVTLRHTLACMILGGEGLENNLESNKKSWKGETVKLRNTLASRVLGGKFKK